MTSAPSMWPRLRRAMFAARVPVRVVDVDHDVAASVSEGLGGEATPAGALAAHCGGLVVEHGWLRVLAAGGEGLPGLTDVAGLVATDVLGGRYVLDDGVVTYLAPDTLDRVGLGCGHAAFVEAVLDGALEELYEPLRWPGWEAEVAQVPLHHGLRLDPPLSTRAGQDVAAARRWAVPFDELAAFLDELADELEASG